MTVNRRERRRYAAELQALAAAGVTVGEVGKCEGAWICDCTACQLLRAGVCMKCAALLTAQILESKAGDTVNASFCSDACREGVERWSAARAISGSKQKL
jgi:hypothetical protein